MKKRTTISMMLIMSILLGIFTGCSGNKTEETVAPVSNVEKVSTKETDKVVKSVLHLNVTADKGWDKDSTPAIAHIVSDDKKVDFYHAVSPDKSGKAGSSEVELKEGKYTVEFVSPLNKDGSAYEIYDTGKKQEVAIDADSENDNTIECPMKQIPADKVTDEMVKDIVAKTKDAVEGGDETLKGDAGKAVLENLEKNVAANPNATDETKKGAEATKETAKTDKKPEGTAKTEDKTTSDSNTASENKTASGNNTQAVSDNNTASNNNAQPSQPAHQHVWKDHTATRQVWVPNVVTVDDYAQQQVKVGYDTVCNCGYRVRNGDIPDEHIIAHIKAGEWDNFWWEDVYEWQNVKVGSHTEDHGYYTTETYIDYSYCDCGATR